MNCDKTAGVLDATLEHLAYYRKMIEIGRLAALGHGTNRSQGIQTVLEFIAIFNATAAPTENLGMTRHTKGTEKTLHTSELSRRFPT